MKKINTVLEIVIIGTVVLLLILLVNRVHIIQENQKIIIDAIEKIHPEAHFPRK